MAHDAVKSVESVRVVICSHVVFVGDHDVAGPGHSIHRYLLLKHIDHVYVQFPLYSSSATHVLHSSGGSFTSSIHTLTTRLPGLFRHILEYLLGFKLLLSFKQKPKVFIGIDPLNALLGILMKRFGLVEYVIFYTADYAVDRFENTILNRIYHMIDRTAVKHVDTVWNVSTRIIEVRKNMGVEKSRNKLVPNAPLLRDLPPAGKKRVEGMILVANFTPMINYDVILDVFEDIHKRYEAARLSFVGTGVKESHVKNEVKKRGLKTAVKFYGLKTHEQTLKIISQHMIGLAPYSDVKPWTKYGDSRKAREYLAYGLPVVISNTVSTADDIIRHSAGFSVDMTYESIYSAVSSLYKSKKRYATMQKSAFKLATDTDLEHVLERELIRRYRL